MDVVDLGEQLAGGGAIEEEASGGADGDDEAVGRQGHEGRRPGSRRPLAAAHQRR